MPASDPHHARVRSVLESALTGDGAADAWAPPSVEALWPLFPAYAIEALIGRGGMGAVYRARQRSLDRRVAIKLLPFELGVREDFAERFRHEAEALARLNHPGIVAVHDFGQADDGHYFIVMEYVAGTDLAARLRESGPLQTDEALAVVRQVCDALEYAHARGVVHRDIKPGNILLDAEGRVKVTDFGLAQLAGDEPRTARTVTGALLGTPEYVAPEQAQAGAVVDARADIFSVGVMLYELLTGQLPRGVFRPLAQAVPQARGLDRVVQRALQSDPARRYATVRELRAELAPRKAPRVPALVATSLAAAALVAAWSWWPQKPAAPVRPPVAAEPAPFVNSLGLRFVPAGTPGVLFCTTETRVRDFSAYQAARSLPTFPAPAWVNYTGVESGWQQVKASWKEPGFTQADTHPVVAVSQLDALDFCSWLTAHERASGRLGAQDRYRLPTNAEWSVAAGLKADALFPSGYYAWGADFPPTTPNGNYGSEDLPAGDERYARFAAIMGYRDGHAFTAPVGSYAADARGLHDLGGNVWEWTDEGTMPRTVLRGGGWGDARAEKLDLATRITHERDIRCYTFGFRLVLERKEQGRPRPE
jgi:hypothetical protein